MYIQKQKMIDFLLANANPSIKRRVKSEILNDLSHKEASLYQEEILAEPIMQKIAALQDENGWIGLEFYGGGSLESHDNYVKYLSEKAVDKDTPVLKRVMDAFVNIPIDNPYYGLAKERIIDEFKYPCAGANLMRCACIARARYDDIIDISPQVQLALDSFERVTEVNSIFDILHEEKVRGKVRYVFNDYEKWVSRNHLDILAHTSSWKTDENIRTKMVAEDVFKNWNKFGGLQLEIDWKSKTRKLCDITFRALLILHYSDNKNPQ